MDFLAGFDVPVKESPWSRCKGVELTCAVLLALAFISVCLRLWTRIGVTRNFGIDDVFIILSLLSFGGFCTLTIAISQLITGRSLLPYTRMTKSINLLVAAESLYILTMAVFKVSLGAFFLRMLKDRLPRRLIQISISIFTLYSTAYFFSTVFNCGVPTGDRYLRKILSNECLAHDTALGLAYTHAALTAGTDLMFIGLSVAAVRHTRTTTREKWVIATILSVGAVGCTASFVRIAFLPVLVSKSNDFFYNSLYLAIWSSLEPGLGIIASSLAITRPVFVRFGRCLRDSNSPIIATLFKYGTAGKITLSSTFVDRKRKTKRPPKRKPKQPEPHQHMPQLGKKRLSHFFGIHTDRLVSYVSREKREPKSPEQGYEPKHSARGLPRKKLSNFFGIQTRLLPLSFSSRSKTKGDDTLSTFVEDKSRPSEDQMITSHFDGNMSIVPSLPLPTRTRNVRNSNQQDNRPSPARSSQQLLLERAESQLRRSSSNPQSSRPHSNVSWRYDRQTNTWRQEGGGTNRRPDSRQRDGLSLGIFDSSGSNIVDSNSPLTPLVDTRQRTVEIARPATTAALSDFESRRLNTDSSLMRTSWHSESSQG